MEDVFNKAKNAFIIVGSLLLAYVVWKLLNKFNILGESENTKEARLLGTDKVFNDAATNVSKNPKNEFLIAIKKKFGLKPTAKQLDSLLPNKNNYPDWVTTINFDVHKNFTPNDSTKIFNIFKLMANQWEINFFSTVFSLTTKQDMYAKLDKLMSDSDMAKLRDTINSKPII